MSDNLKRYRAIQEGILQLYPGEPTGHLRQSLNVLAMFINGIVASKRTHTREVAKKTPTSAKVTSREKQLVRWYQNEKVTYACHMLPFVQELLAHLSAHTLVLAIDGSDVGRHCVTLLVSLIYQKRAIPLLWLVRTGSKGHFPAEMHIDLLNELQALLPDDAAVILLGDGEFDSVELQTFLNDAGWGYVCRTAKNTLVQLDGEWMHLDEIDVWPDSCLPLPEVLFTQQAYGPVLAIAWWRSGYAEPIYLVTNLDLMQEACLWYQKRMKIETFFSDQKSRGFHLHQSHIDDPQRLARVMIAACLAYIWMIYLGVLCRKDGWIRQLHRTDRCDLSLFQLGIDLLEYFLNEHLPIPVHFTLQPVSPLFDSPYT
jgi:hypothetical protein